MIHGFSLGQRRLLVTVASRLPLDCQPIPLVKKELPRKYKPMSPHDISPQLQEVIEAILREGSVPLVQT